MYTHIKKPIYITLFLLLAIGGFFISPSLAEGSPAPTYTPLPTYTPQGGIPTATPTPFPTATPYGWTPLPEQVETDAVVSPSTSAILSEIVLYNSLPQGYVTSQLHPDERKILGIEGLCLPIGGNPSSEWFGTICFYKTNEGNLSIAERMRVFERENEEGLLPDAPTFGEASQTYLVYSEDAQKDEYAGDFVYGDWVGGFDFRALGNNETLPEMEKVFMAVLDAFPQPSTVTVTTDQLSDTQSAMEYFHHLLFEENAISQDYVFGGEHTQGSWSGAEIKNCFNADYQNMGIGTICFYRDNRPTLTATERLTIYTDLGNEETLQKEQPQLGEASAIYHGFHQDAEQHHYYHGVFVEGVWLGEFFINLEHENQSTAELNAMNDLVNQFLPLLDAAPTDLRQESIELPYGDIFDHIFDGVEMPEGFSVSPHQEHGFDVFYGPSHLNIGNITFSSISPWRSDAIFTHFEYASPIQSVEPPEFGDYSEFGIFMDPNTRTNKMTLTFRRSNLFVNITLDSLGDVTRRAMKQLAAAMAEKMPEAPYVEMPLNGDPVEQQFLRCFPKQSEIGFSSPMHQYTYYTRLLPGGFEYNTRYTSFDEMPKWQFTGFLDVSIIANQTIFGLQDIQAQEGATLTPLPNIGERAYIYSDGTLARLNFRKGPVIVKLFTIVLEENSADLERLPILAKEIADCLPENPLLPANISPPGDMNTQEVNPNYLSIAGIIGVEEPPKANISELPVIDKYNWSKPLALQFEIYQDLTAPLTIMIYSPKYDIFSYRKQEKEIPSPDWYETVLGFSNKDVLPPGENILYVWMGDELVAEYPFYIGGWHEDE